MTHIHRHQRTAPQLFISVDLQWVLKLYWVAIGVRPGNLCNLAERPNPELKTPLPPFAPNSRYTAAAEVINI